MSAWLVVTKLRWCLVYCTPLIAGAHTVGKAHCSSFSGRLRNFSPQNQTDPSLDPKYAASLQKECPSNVSPSVIVSMDPISNRTFDNAYYTDVEAHKGLFSSDPALLNSGVSSAAVAGFASNNGDFLSQFAAAFLKVGY
ncbi:unnamed protein product [Calypogeia fissa]